METRLKGYNVYCAGEKNDSFLAKGKKKINYKISELLVGIDLHIVGLLEQTASVVEVGNSILIWSSQLFLV